MRALRVPPGSAGHAAGEFAARRFAGLKNTLRPVLTLADTAHRVLGTRTMTAAAKGLHALGLPQWLPSMPRAYRLPETLRTAGIDPAKLKWLASILCGVFCALAGAHLSLGQLQGTFAENMSNNRGYIAFACVIFGAANPPKAYLAALMFGFFDAIGLRLQEYLSADLTNLIPYVITVVMMVYVVVRAQQRKKHRARSALAQKGKSA